MTTLLTLWAILGAAGLAGLIFYFRPLPAYGDFPPARQKFSLGDQLFALLLACFFFYNAWSSIGKPITITPTMLVDECIFTIALVLLVAGVIAAQRRNPLVAFGLIWPGWKARIHQIPIVFVFFFPVMIFLQIAVTAVLGNHSTPQVIVEYLAKSTGWEGRAAVALMACIFAPFGEEFIFRGFLYGVARQTFGRWFGMVITSVLFAFIHTNLAAFFGLFAFSIVLTLVYEKTGSLLASMLLHSILNSVTVIVTVYYPNAV